MDKSIQRPSIQKFFKQRFSSSKQTSETSQSITQMIQLLKQYQKQCQSNCDFQSADDAKNKIEFLKSQELMLRKQRFQQENKQNMMQVSEKGQRQVRQFQQKWQAHFEQVVETLKASECDLIKQHEIQLQQISKRLNDQQVPSIKYSTQVLSLRSNLKNLIKARNYKQAQFIKNKLDKRQEQERIKWGEAFQNKKKLRLQLIRKKQHGQLKALRVKLQAVFNQTIKQRNSEFQILLKKNRKKMIESSKLSRQKITSKAAMLNQSRTYSMVSKY